MNIEEFAAGHGLTVGQVSDGYHTFDDLYNQRLYLFATIVNLKPSFAWKSKKHEDGNLCFGGGWFVVGINTPEGPYTYHYEEKHWDLFKCKELDKAPPFDGHTSENVDRLMSLIQKPCEWAQKEVDLAIKYENSTEIEGTADLSTYITNCYSSALKAYESLSEDSHSGFSISITQKILNKLISHKPLTPIEDDDSEWSIVDDSIGSGPIYQNKRYSSLFKSILPTGEIEYNHVNDIVCVEIDAPNAYFTNGFISKYVRPFFPITFPYVPNDKQVIVQCETFLVDEKNGDFDTRRIIKAGREGEESIIINKYFKELPEVGFIEIDESEYNERLAKKIK